MLLRVKGLIIAGAILVFMLVTLGFVSILPWVVIGVLCAVALGIFGWLINLESRTKETPASPTSQHVKPIGEIKLRRKSIVDREIVLEPDDYDTFAINLKEHEHLLGQVSSESPINVFLVTKYGLTKYENREDFSYEECGGENIKRTTIDFETAGKWFLIVENEGDEDVSVKVRLYTETKLPLAD